MKKFRRILQSFVPEVLPSGESLDVCEGISKILSRGDVMRVIAYAPWSRAESYEQIGLTRCAERGVPVQILVRMPGGTLRSDLQSLLKSRSICSSLSILTPKAAAGRENALNHRKIIAILLKERGWIAVTGSSNHTKSGFGRVDLKESRIPDGQIAAHLNDEYNVVIQLSEKDSVLQDLFDGLASAGVPDPSSFPLTSGHHELDDSTRPVSSVEKALFPFQQDAVGKLNESWKRFRANRDSPHGAILSMPTGSGKTFTAVRWVCERLASDEGIRRVLWLAPSVELIWQAHDTWIECKNYHPESVRIVVGDSSAADEESTEEDDGPMVIILTIQAAAKAIESMAAMDLIVVDEAHWGSFLLGDSESSRQGKGMLERIIEGARNLEEQSTRVFALGLTATPYRTELHQISDIADLLCGEDSPYDVVVHVEESVADEFTSDGLRLRPRVEVTDIGFLPPAMEATASGLSIILPDNQSIRDLGSDPDMITQMAKRYGNLKPKLALAFAVDSESAIKIAAKFQKDFAGVQILISGSLDSEKSIRVAKKSPHAPTGPRKSFTHEDRKRIYDSMKRGDGRVRLLITVKMARMGIDVPGIDALFMAVPTKSPLWYRQMLGRGMRGPLVGGPERLWVVDCFKSEKLQNEVHANLMHYAGAMEDSAMNDRFIRSVNWIDKILDSLKHVSIDEACEHKRWEGPGVWCSLMPKANKFSVEWAFSINLSESIRRKNLRRNYRLVAYRCDEEATNSFKDSLRTKKCQRRADEALARIFGY